MPTSKYQRSLSTLRHRLKEVEAEAANRSIALVRGGAWDEEERKIDAIRAVATFEAVKHDLDLLETIGAAKPIGTNGRTAARQP